MATRGTPALSKEDVVEVVDLYRWGARVSDIELIYDVHRRTMKQYLVRAGVKLRPKNGQPFVESGTKRPYVIKSTRPQIPEGVRIRSGDDPDADQLIRKCAHELQDKRIAARRLDASMRSSQVSAS